MIQISNKAITGLKTHNTHMLGEFLEKTLLLLFNKISRTFRIPSIAAGKSKEIRHSQ
jgi:hypothetical protein